MDISKNTNNSLLLGVQVSIASDIAEAINRASQLRCNAMQIFARNPRQFRKNIRPAEDIKNFSLRLKQSNIKLLVIHTPYTLNLAAKKDFLYRVSIEEFIEDIKEADSLQADYIVIHTGYYQGNTKKGLHRLIDGLIKTLQATEGVKVKILLENTAGGRYSLGNNLINHGYIFRHLIPFAKRIGLCLDTAHAWAAGYKLTSEKEIANLEKEIKKQLGENILKLIHLNDTEQECGSGRDRHYHLGKGKIGVKGFKALLANKFFRKTPLILETPKKDINDDIKNLNFVRKLYKKVVQEQLI